MNARTGPDTVPGWLHPAAPELPSDWHDAGARASEPAAWETATTPTRRGGHVSHDLSTLFRSMGMQALRASVLDLGSMAVEAAWTVTERGEVLREPQVTDASAIPGAASLASQLAHAAPDETVVQKLGPRRWTFAWRLDARRFLAGEVRYRYGRNEAREMDTALVRLMCTVGLQQAVSANDADDAAPAAHAPGRDAAAVAPPSGPRWAWPLALGATLASAALAGWLALATLPRLSNWAAERQVESTRLLALTESTMTRSVAGALAAGDYGEVQHELQTLESLGYFKQALVTNQRARVVALAGTGDAIRVGIELPGGTLPNARTYPLQHGDQVLGKLVVLSPTTPDAQAASRLDLLRMLSLGSVAASLAAAVWIAKRR